MVRPITMLCLSLLLVASPAFSQDSGFISDVPRLETLDGVENVRVWKVPDIEQKYRAVYFDPPEIVLAPDSEYKGIQPDAVKALSDLLHDILTTDASERGREIAEELGSDIVRVRSAVSNVYFKRRSGSFRYPFNYDGFRLRAVMPEVSLVQATLEFELLDGESGRRVGILILQEGQRSVRLDAEDYANSWSELVNTLRLAGRAAGRYFSDLVDVEL